MSDTPTQQKPFKVKVKANVSFSDDLIFKSGVEKQVNLLELGKKIAEKHKLGNIALEGFTQILKFVPDELQKYEFEKTWGSEDDESKE